jgi:sugar phosphate isomerase/epimerase
MTRAPAPAPAFSLAYLTAPDLSPPDMIRAAARTGYQYVGIRVLPAAPGGELWPLLEDLALLAETRAAIKATGVKVFDIEIIRIGANFHPKAHGRFLETCAALGAAAILVAGDDPDEARLTANYAAFCEAARPYQLTADLECMPWTEIKTIAQATRIAVTSGQPNAGVLVDALHWARSRSTRADVAAIPPALLHYAQLCDAPAAIPTTLEGLLHTARVERYLPGEGGIDLVGLLNVLPTDLPISLEIPNEPRRPALGSEEWGRQALVAAKALLARRQLHTTSPAS